MPNQVPLTRALQANDDNSKDSPGVKALRAAWLQKKAQIFAGKLTKPDSEDPDTVNHLNWYMPPGLRGPIQARKQFAPERIQQPGTRR